jgi:hypothetical protein
LVAVPFAGIPWSAYRGFSATRRLGERAHQYVRSRRAIRDTLQRVLEEASLDMELLLEGAWFLSSCDGVVTHDELLLISALARSIPAANRPSLEHLRFAGEGAWIMRLIFLDDARRAQTLRALETIAALRGPVGHAERSYLQRIGEALAEPIDLARIDRIREQVVADPATDRAGSRSRSPVAVEYESAGRP